MVRRLLIAATIALFALGATPPKKKAPAPEPRSGYFAQHATDAVKWQRWGEPAFAIARKESKPIFLSIGFASCRWCHVMQRESFAPGPVAELINASFVPVLVDRDELPEIDAAYIAITGNGGWPSNLILTPDLQPVAAGAYMNPEALRSFLATTLARWNTERESLLADARAAVAKARLHSVTAPPPDTPTSEALERAFASAKAAYDVEHGGFGTAPKFPQPMTVSFLLRYGERTKSATARDMAIASLRAMARGGIRDQLAGGFHRYTSDAAWRAPHFEKMLPDQALMAHAYLDAWQLTGDAMFADVARSTLDYVINDLRPARGAFDASQDAESITPGACGPEFVDGAFYRWTTAEFDRLLGKRADLFKYYYGMREGEPYVLAVAHSDAMVRQRFGMNEQQLAEALAAGRKTLFQVRQTRPEPFRNEMVITGWNGLMISALARGGAVLDDPKYVTAASDAAHYLATKHWDAKTKKLRRTPTQDALAEDYAFFVQGLIDLYEASFETRWLDLAVELQQRQDALFWNEATSRYLTGTTVPSSLAGVTAERDAMLPAASSASAMNLLRLSELTESTPWRARAATIFRTHTARLGEFAQLAAALESSLAPPRQIVIVGDARKDDTKALLRAVRSRFLPNRAVLLVSGPASQAKLAQYLPVVKEMKPIGEAATAYVCERSVCRTPVTEPAALGALLGP